MLENPHETFDLPEVDADSIAEAGVVMMGVDAQRLLATLGVAALTAEPGSVLRLVDQGWHQGMVTIPFDVAVAAGADQWRTHRPALTAADDSIPRSGAPREAWTSVWATAMRALGERTASTALVCLAVAWFRREEIDEATGGH